MRNMKLIFFTLIFLALIVPASYAITGSGITINGTDCLLNGSCTVTGVGGGGGADPLGYYLVDQSTNAPANAVNLGGLSSGFLKCSVSGGVCTVSSDTNTYLTSIASDPYPCPAVCDGITDDRATINACIHAKRAVILPPRKVCMISDEIDITVSTVTLIGEGTTLNLTVANKNHINVSSGVTDITVKGIIFTTSAASASTSGWAILTSSVGIIHVTDNWVYGNSKLYGGFQFGPGTTYAFVERNHVQNTVSHGIYEYGTGTGANQVSANFIDNVIENSGGHALYLYNYVNGAMIYHNVLFNATGDCLRIDGNVTPTYLTGLNVDLYISDNDLNSCNNNLYLNYLGNFRVLNNSLINPRNSNPALFIGRYASWGIVENNAIWQLTSPANTPGIDAEGTQIDFRGNQIMYGTSGILLRANAQNINITANTITNMSSYGADLTAGPSTVKIAGNTFASNGTNISTGGTSITRSDFAAGTNTTLTDNANGTTTISVTGVLTGITSIDGSSASTTGNAATATKFAATKTINNVAFDGSANIQVTAGLPVATALGTSGTVSLDASLGQIYTITPSGSVILNATNCATGRIFTVIVTSSGTSAYTVTPTTNFKGIALSTGSVSGKTFTFSFICNGTTATQMGAAAAAGM